jgi:hypothetical protein
VSSGPLTLMYMKTVASREDREEAIERKTSGFEYYLLFLPFLLILPYLVVYEFFRARQI